MSIPLPQFSSVKTEKIPQQLDQLLSENLNTLQQQLDKPLAPTWESIIAPLEEMNDRLHQFWSPVSHMNSVVNSEALRKAYNECLPKLANYSTQLSHNVKLYEAVQAIANSKTFKSLDYAQQKIIEHELRDFKLAGVALNQDQKKQFAKLVEKLSQLTSKFEENLLDATNHWFKHISDESLLNGLPDSTKALLKSYAQAKNLDGWVVNLEMPCYIGIMTYADNRELRSEVYQAYATRASDQGPDAGKWDNSSIMHDILATRLAMAKLLGFNNYAELSIATKMVKSTDEVLAFLKQLLDASLPAAQQELAELKNFAKEQLQLDDLQVWDLTYASEKLRQARYNISQEMLRPYFPETTVVPGLFKIVHKLFNITIKPVANFDRWHQDVKCYAVHDENDQVIAYFYLDLYARAHKRGGAWMDNAIDRRLTAHGDLQLPVAYLTCNFNPPQGDAPALFTHNEVITLFHEFGHSLQHMLTKINYADVAGINGIAWDAVEVASQFLENWAWQREGLQYIAQHYQTQQPLPEDLYEKMWAARNFQSAMQMVRQLEFALFDFRLHLEFDPQQDQQVQKILNEVRQQTSLLEIPEFNRFQHGFSHIFAGGYAAGYYSYKWAEVMAADAFSMFEENGIFDATTSRKFRDTFLAEGGAIDPDQVFRDFRGRNPEVSALLKQAGISAHV